MQHAIRVMTLAALAETAYEMAEVDGVVDQRLKAANFNAGGEFH